MKMPWYVLCDLVAKVDVILDIVKRIDRKEDKIMTGQDDLKAAIVQLGVDVDAEIAALIAAQNSGDDAAFEEAANNLKALSTKLQTSLAPKVA